MWRNSRWWLAASCDWVESALSAVLSTRVGCRIKFGEVSCTECTDQANDFELIPTVEMETRNPVEGYFGSEFPVICNHCGFMAAWSLKMFLKSLRNFCIFWKNDPLRKNFQIIVPKVFIATQIDVVVFKCREIWPTGNRWNRALLTWRKKLHQALQLSLLRGLRPKSARASPRQFTQSAPDFIQIGSLSAEL